MTRHTVYALGSLSVAVNCPEPELAKWVHDYLAAYFATHARVSDWTIHVALEPKDLTNARRQFEHSCERHGVIDDAEHGATMCSDGIGHWWMRCRDPDTRRAPFFMRIESARRQVWMTASGDEAETRYAVCRVVRCLLVAAARHRGMPLMHASCVQLAGRGLLFVGEKRAGKTTWMLHALLEHGASFVSNDQVVLGPDDTAGTLQAHGLPLSVTLRPHVRSLLPRIETSYYFQPGEDIRLLVTEFCAQMGCAIVPRCTVDQVIWLQCSPSWPSVEIDRVDRARALSPHALLQVNRYQPVWESVFPACEAHPAKGDAVRVRYPPGREHEAFSTALEY